MKSRQLSKPYTGIAIFAVLLAWTTLPLRAQVVSARMEGVVMDPSQAVIPGVKVVATQEETNFSQESLTNESGRYVFVALPPGPYTVTVSLTGFKGFQEKGVILKVGDAVTLNIKLEAGSVNEVVDVTSEAALLDLTTSKLGSVVENRQAIELPLNGRNAMELFYLSAGTNPFDRVGTSQQQVGGINGLAPHTNNTKIEGIFAGRTGFDYSPASPIVSVPQEAVGEYRITTAGALSDAGRGSGAQVEVLLKSGTNSLHGSLFEFNRNTVYNANDFFNNRAGKDRADYKRNQFGFGVGGPIIRNRTFFFATAEWDRLIQTVIEDRLVYTSTLRDGIFRYNTTGANSSANVDANGNPLVPVGTINLLTVDPTRQGKDTFFLPKILSVMPLPNNYDIGDGLNLGGYRYNARNPQPAWKWLIKIDHQLSARHHLSGMVSWAYSDKLDAVLYTGAPAEDFNVHQKAITLHLVSVLTPHLLNDLSVGANKVFTKIPLFTGQETPAGNIQLTGLTSSATDSGLFGSQNGNIYLNGRGLQSNPNDNIGFNESMSWVKGNHTLHYGGEMLFSTLNVQFASGAYPTLNTDVTANPANVPALAGLNSTDRARAQQLTNDLTGTIGSITQSFFLTNKTGYSAFQPLYTPIHNIEWSAYVQDVWKLRPNFSVNVGVRYEILPIAYMANGVFIQPVGGLAGALGIQGPTHQPTSFGLTPDGHSGIPTRKNNFGPHLGFIWDPFGDGKTSISGSYGIAYDRAMLITHADFSANNYGGTTLVTLTPFTRLSDPNLYKTILPIATPQAFAPLGFTRDSRAYVLDPNLKTPYVQTWDFQISRQIGNSWKAEASYVGNHAVGQWQANNLDQLQMRSNGFLDAFKIAQSNLALNGSPVKGADLGNLTPLFNLVPSSQFTLITQGQAAALANFLDTTTLNTGTRGGLVTQAGLPVTFFRYNPQVTNLNVVGNLGHSTWDGLKVGVTRRMSAGMYLSGNYTFSKGFTNFIPGQTLYTDFRDNANLKLDKNISPLDSTHTIIANWLYELPLGTGKHFLSHGNRVVQGVLGGWQINGIYNHVTGRPLNITTGRFDVSANTASTPNYSGPIFNLSNPFDAGGQITTLTASQKALFTNPGPGETGQLPKYSFRGPGLSTLDMSLFKHFKVNVRERAVDVQLRLEAFNALNHVNFQNPQTNINNGSFGVITSAYPARIGQLALKVLF